MRKYLFSGIVAAALLALGGCAQPEPVTSDNAQPEQTVEQNQTRKDTAATPTVGTKLAVVYFDFDSYTLRADQQGTVNEIASKVKDIVSKVVNSNPSISFRIEGNCDERGAEEYNYALGLKRAKAVQDALVSIGVSADRLNLISYGESNPVCAQSTSDCFRQNRRAEINVLQ
ncbi:MAG: OmpA family protein [Helicobacteraceae bacterium]|nr:OmpA family protein [Helicobacteraceae bacterium]